MPSASLPTVSGLLLAKKKAAQTEPRQMLQLHHTECTTKDMMNHQLTDVPGHVEAKKHSDICEDFRSQRSPSQAQKLANCWISQANGWDCDGNASNRANDSVHCDAGDVEGFSHCYNLVLIRLHGVRLVIRLEVSICTITTGLISGDRQEINRHILMPDPISDCVDVLELDESTIALRTLRGLQQEIQGQREQATFVKGERQGSLCDFGRLESSLGDCIRD
jgi:hypothetical protein